MSSPYYVGREIAAGSVAASYTAALFNPLEIVKTRLQVQHEIAAAEGQAPLYRGFSHALRKIATEDGLLLFWQHGFVGFVGRDALYSGIRIGAYPSIRNFYAGAESSAEISLLSKFAAGMTTGAIGSFIANPFDVVRVRTSSEGGKICSQTGLYTTGLYAGSKPSYRNAAHAFVSIFKIEGVKKGLWRGSSATMTRAMALSGGHLASYDHSKLLLKQNTCLEEGTSLHIISAIISGIVATTCCNPPDVVKSRLMLERATVTNASSRGPLAIGFAIWKEKGVLGFFQGWLPSYARAFPTSFIQMPLVERLRLWFGIDFL